MQAMEINSAHIQWTATRVPTGACSQTDYLSQWSVTGFADDRPSATDQLTARCQRSGHAMAACGPLHVVVVGGILRVPLRKMDVLCVNMRTLTISRCAPDAEIAQHCVSSNIAYDRPVVHGKRPRARFRHSCCTLRCDQVSAASRLHEQLLAQLPPGALDGGHLLLVFGGYNAQGEEFGGNRVEVRWRCVRKRVGNAHGAIHTMHGTSALHVHPVFAQGIINIPGAVGGCRLHHRPLVPPGHRGPGSCARLPPHSRSLQWGAPHGGVWGGELLVPQQVCSVGASGSHIHMWSWTLYINHPVCTSTTLCVHQPACVYINQPLYAQV